MTDVGTTPEERAQKRAKDFTGMLWHVAAFVIINAMLWTIDLISGGRYWAFWITLFWGVGLLFHVAWYFIDVSREGRRYEKFLADEQKKSGAPL
jgi:2TM domain